MQATAPNPRVPGAQLCLAMVLLVGVVAIAYGYYRPSTIAFYAGLLLTIGGVVVGVVRILTQSGRGA